MGEVIELMEQTSLGAWKRAAAAAQVDVNAYIDHPLTVGEPLPWSMLDSGMPNKFFSMELARAGKLNVSRPCPPAGCKLCGVC